MAEMTDSDAGAERRRERWPRLLVVAFGGVIVAGLWLGVFWGLVCVLRGGLPPVSRQGSLSDLATLVFGTSGIALAIFSILVGGIAIAGWNTIKENVRTEIEASLRGNIEALSKEIRGRQLASIGMVLGLFYARQGQDGSQDEDVRSERASYLQEVIGHCKAAYKLLKEVDSPGQYMALNNYVYFSCLQGGPSPKGFLLKTARELKRIGEEKNYWEALITYCQAVATFGDEQAEIRDAHELATELSTKEELTARQRREAKACAASLLNRLTNQTTTGGGVGA